MSRLCQRVAIKSHSAGRKYEGIAHLIFAEGQLNPWGRRPHASSRQRIKVWPEACIKGDACLTLPAAQSRPGSSVPNPPMRKCPVAGHGSKAANQRANFVVSSPQRFILEKWPCWALAQLLPGSIGSHPPGQLVGGKVGGLLHQENNYPRKKWVKLSHSPLPHSPSAPVGSINLALVSFCRPARQRPKPLLAHGQNDLQRRAFDLSLRKSPKKTCPPSEFNFTLAKW